MDWVEGHEIDSSLEELEGEISRKALRGSEAYKQAKLCLESVRQVVMQTNALVKQSCALFLGATLTVLQQHMSTSGGTTGVLPKGDLLSAVSSGTVVDRNQPVFVGLCVLLRGLLERVQHTSIVSRMSSIQPLLLGALKHAETTGNEQACKHLLQASETLVRATYTVNSTPNRKVPRTVLPFCQSNTPAVRTAAVDVVAELLRNAADVADEGTTGAIVQWLSESLADLKYNHRDPEKSIATAHALLESVKKLHRHFSQTARADVCVRLARLVKKAGQNRLTSDALMCLKEMADKERKSPGFAPTAAALSGECLAVLTTVKPNSADTLFVKVYVETGGALACLLAEAERLSRDQGAPVPTKIADILPSLLPVLKKFLMDSDPSVVRAASEALSQIVKAAAETDAETLGGLIPFFSSLITFKNKQQWRLILPAFSQLFSAADRSILRQTLGGDAGLSLSQAMEGDVGAVGKALETARETAGELFRPLTERIFEILKSSTDPKNLLEASPYRQEVTAAAGAALRAFGVSHVFSLLPLGLTDYSLGDEGYATKSNSFLLPFLKTHLKRDSLKPLVQQIIPAAGLLASRYRSSKSDLEKKKLWLLVEQCWALLPCFFRSGTDLGAALTRQNFALSNQMATLLDREPALREFVCQALTVACRDASADLETETSLGLVEEEDATVLRLTQSKNRALLGQMAPKFLPLLFTSFVKIHKKAEEAEQIEQQQAAVKVKEEAGLMEDTKTKATLSKRAATVAASIQAEVTQQAKAKSSQHILEVVSAYGCLCPPELVDSFLKNICQRILKASMGQQAGGMGVGTQQQQQQQQQGETSTTSPAEMAALADLADALVPHISDPTVPLVIRAFCPLLSVRIPSPSSASRDKKRGTAEVLRVLQRRAYKVVKHVCSRLSYGRRGMEKADVWEGRTGGLATKTDLVQLWETLRSGRDVVVEGSQKGRLGCLHEFVVLLDRSRLRAVEGGEGGVMGGGGLEGGDSWDDFVLPVASELVPEILLSMREVSKDVRGLALDLLRALADCCSHRAKQLLAFVGTGLAGSSQGMKAASVLALSRLVYSLSSSLDEDSKREVVDTMLILLRDPDRQVFKEAVAFLRVASHVLTAEELRGRAGEIFAMPENKNALAERLSVRRVTERLIRKLGPDTVRVAFPEKHRPLLVYLQRQARKKRRKEEKRKSGQKDAGEEDDEDMGVGADAGGKGGRQGRKQSAGAGEVLGMRKKTDGFKQLVKGEADDSSDDDDNSSVESDGETGSSRKKVKDEEMGDASGGGGGRKGSAAPPSLRQLLDAWEEDSDSDLDSDLEEAVSGGKGKAKKAKGRAKRDASSAAVNEMTGSVWLMDSAADGMPIDFMAPEAAHAVLTSDPRMKRRRMGGDGSARGDKERRMGLEYDDEGRLVVPAEDGGGGGDDADMLTDAEGLLASASASSSSRKKSVGGGKGDKGGEAGADSKQRTGLSRLKEVSESRKAAIKQRSKKQGHSIQKSGDSWKSKRGSGDVKGKSKINPYAYLRLNPKMAKEKNKDRATRSLATVVKSAKGGVKKGLKARHMALRKLKK
uniref:RRP12 HEAT domain-containing protein n=1 Tax=Chromera velia CCMP2878 TaxID=1169474 RepID=A0A0G4F1D1_9ALVE|eukprot:Cvel_14703.t1-p1 / transcript=Cvel_14703.t1 / gene=Cvel_14703 / organism=Chromera_velia_CCMP2878 / gene_product=hypothetical protein / transcript_product=hypothetical protein / location=Cvel_scaffold1056:2963-12868(+) / protein_length=1557 / sequence_SO=supercontig / SO=protein_coding / is_pseudo=false